MEYAFHLHNKLASDGICMSLDRLLRSAKSAKNKKNKGAGTRLSPTPMDAPQPPPVVVCIGSDLAIGDSLGPIVGSMLQFKTQGLGAFIYGTLASPVTAKEIRRMPAFLRETHGNAQILAIDAAVGEKGDIGLIKISDSPLLPGAGANKKLGEIGDVSLMGIVAEKSLTNYALLNTTRLNLVYSLADIISTAVSHLLWERSQSFVQKNA